VKQTHAKASTLVCGSMDAEEPLIPADWLQDDFAIGVLLGLLVGEGHFGGDGRQAHITLRMHTRHRRVFDWLLATFPGGRLYGPYTHGGRSYYQWMARGRFLADELVPLIAAHLPGLDDHAAGRFTQMCARYGLLATTHPGRPPASTPNATG
jgi:hypothetical protein